MGAMPAKMGAYHHTGCRPKCDADEPLAMLKWK
jgi:hypothetical protein